MKKHLILPVLLIVSQVSLTNHDFSYEGKQYSAAALSEKFYDKVLNNYSFTSWISIKNSFFLLAAIKCYENMDKNDARLSNKAKYELQGILDQAGSLLGGSWDNIRFKCKAFCLMYGGYLLPDEPVIASVTAEKNK